jgi:hypothetical protein
MRARCTQRRLGAHELRQVIDFYEHVGHVDLYAHSEYDNT